MQNRRPFTLEMQVRAACVAADIANYPQTRSAMLAAYVASMPADGTGASPDMLAEEIAGYARQFPGLFALFETWIKAYGPDAAQALALYFIVEGNHMLGEVLAVPYKQVQYSVPPVLRLAVREIWEANQS